MMNRKSRLPNLKLGFTITRKYRTLKKMSFKYINITKLYSIKGFHEGRGPISQCPCNSITTTLKNDGDPSDITQVP